MSRRLAHLWLATLALAWVGCGPPRDGAMVSIPVPAGYEATLADDRTAKDEFFRTSSESPLPQEDLEGFGGLDYWEPDPDYYFVGSIHAYLEPEQFEIPTTSGTRRPCERYGRIGFRVDGTLHSLQVYRLLDSESGTGLLLPFRDTTSGTETYPAGRYVDLVGPPGGPYVLDFNRAYNPSCAYGEPERFACPVTPRSNRLDLRVEVGERGFKR